jgi:hypothetical protein
MRMLTVTEQVRLASIRMLRGVFSGIGQLLLAADRFRAEEAATESGHADANGPQDPLSRWESRVAQASAVTATIADRDEASVRPGPTSAQAHPEPPRASPGRRGPAPAITSPAPQASQVIDEPAAPVSSPPSAPAKATPAKATPAKATPAKATPAKATPASATPAAASRSGQSTKGPAQAKSRPARSPKAAPPPIPGYDDLSIASLRARLRGLTTSQLGKLVDYERSHANRDDVVTMFERRITKLEAGDG